VHRGFKKALDAIRKDHYARLESIRESGCSIWMAGHSLGAALATLAGDRYEKTRAVYTFGSPGMGNTVFSENSNATTIRWRSVAFKVERNVSIDGSF
jgi:triacylglycerol lipase